MTSQLDTKASAPDLGVETGPRFLEWYAGHARAGSGARPLFHRGALGWVRSFLLLVAGAAIASAIWLSFRAVPRLASAETKAYRQVVGGQGRQDPRIGTNLAGYRIEKLIGRAG